jgi:hypothetical protein
VSQSHCADQPQFLTCNPGRTRNNFSKQQHGIIFLLVGTFLTSFHLDNSTLEHCRDTIQCCGAGAARSRTFFVVPEPQPDVAPNPVLMFNINMMIQNGLTFVHFKNVSLLHSK